MKPSLFTLFLLFVGPSFSQTTFWTDTFEDAGAPSSGTRNASSDFSCSATPTSYFMRTDGILNLTGSYESMEGTMFWAGEDLDQGASCTDASQSPLQTILWSGIDISGRTSIAFSGLFAANDITANNWDGTDAGSDQDRISVEYRIDGGSWSRLLEFRADAASNSNSLRLDTDNDQIGDGLALSYTFTEFTGSVGGIGSLLDLRLSISSDDAGTEELAVDNFRLTNSAFLPVGLSSFISQCEQDKEVIHWTSESEDHLDYYELEISYDATKYQTITKVEAAGSDGSMSYFFTIPESFEMPVYYRLKMADLDGSFSYSDIISSKSCSAKDNGLLRSFFVQNGALTCTFRGTNLDYELLTPEGYSVTGKKNTANKLQLSLATDLNQGMYLLRLSDPQQTEPRIYRIFVN